MDGSSSTARATALPAGIYRKYKASTDFFKRWLLGAGLTLGVASRKSSNNDRPIDFYTRVVHAVAAQPTMLTPAQLHHWPRALAACQSAITLRERAALFFPALPNDSHAHFLSCLKEWLLELQQATRPVAVDEKTKTESPLNFTNYYEVLALPDDYFDAKDEDVLAVPVSKPSKSSKATAAQRKKLFDEAFTEDLNAELACLIMELEELCEGVYAAYFDIKYGKSTLLEATAVASVAISSAAHVIAKLQLNYPAIRSAPDLIHLLEDRIPKKAFDKLQLDMYMNWCVREGRPLYQYVPGTLLADVVWLGKTLHAWGAKVIPANPKASFMARASVHGEMYDEDETPDYTDPDVTTSPHFMVQQLPLLYNLFVANRGIKASKDSLAMEFLGHFDDFFRTRVPSIHLVFVCACWVRSVAALQGHRYLSRTISLSHLHRWELEKRLRASIAKGAVRRADPSLHNQMENMLQTVLMCDNTTLLTRANPIFAGCVQLDNQFRYLHLGSDSILVKSQFRAFCHIYNALRDRRLIDTIPFIEDALRVYEPAVFTPSREVATQGSFFRAYLVSSHMTDAAIDAAMDERAAVSDRFATRVRPHFRLSELTRTFCLLRKRDVSVLPAGSTASWQTMLKAVGELCSKELFDTRVLSRDMLKLSDDLDDLFEAMCDALGQRVNAQRRLAGGYPNQSRQFAINRAVEDSVVIPLLPLIGCLNVDGTTRISADSKFCVRLEGLRDLGEVVDGPVIVNYARKAVEVISRTFLERTPAEVESAYFTLPPTPEWVLDEFQTVYADDVDGLESQPASEVFERLMEMLKTSKGPLVGESLTQLKDAIIVLPEILEMTTNDELCSLYHHAAAGPARDRRLVEWMHQHEAQKVQPKHCRLRTSPEVLAAQGTRKLCNELAVHSATKVGDLDIVRLLLEACHLHDIDTVTYHTRDSLAHLAVKHGHKTLFKLLKAFDADVTRKNADGKFVYDLTTDADWRRSIVELALVQRRHQVSMNREGATTTSQFRQQNQAAADKLRRELSAQQEAEHRQLRAVSSKKPNFQAATRLATSSETQESLAGPRDGEPSTEAAVNGATKKKRKKKTKKKKQKSAVPADEMDTTETNLLERLQLHENDDESDSDSDFEPSSYEKLNLGERLARWFHVLKESSTASAEQRRCSAIDVIYSLRNLRDKLQTYATANAALMRSEMMEKDAVDAHGALLQLNKYYRQLPHPINAQASLDRWTLELQDLAGREFAQFLSFAANTSHVLVACNRATQAQEVLAVVERRLLKTIEQSTAPSIRRYVELFVEARQHAKLEPPTGSTPEAQQLFERILTTGQDEVEVN